uniref:Uncharacterized protein n=1 Tax=viral metagenome TaxID=1070528 RepID=A0A6C0KMQ7_9ZZZZ
MNNIFILCLYSLLTTISSSIEPKLCINCKYYVKDFFSSDKFGKCYLNPTIKDNYFLVNGKIDNENIDLHYCSTARKFDDMCGEKAKKFVIKDKSFPF